MYYSLDLFIMLTPNSGRVYTLGRHTESECKFILESIGAVNIKKTKRQVKNIQTQYYCNEGKMIDIFYGELHVNW